MTVRTLPAIHQDSVAALQKIRTMATGRERIVFVSGNFNVLHPGHLRLLRHAAECGDFLVVGIYADDLKRGALMNERLRLEGVEAPSYVDHGFILRDAPENFILHLKPAIVVKGKEHENFLNPELAAVQSYQGKLLFSSGDVSFSSIDLLKEEFRKVNLATIVKPQDYPQRHGFGMPDLVNVIDRFPQLSVMVIGETIVDEYISCDPVGMSQEDPTIVVTPILTERFIGAAGIVAAHARGLGADVRFFSVVGKDEAAAFARQRLKEYGVQAHLYEDESRPTIRKQRFRAEGKTLLRVNHLHQHAITRELQRQMVGDMKEQLADADLLIFSDFNYGCLPQPLVDDITSFCHKENILMVADSQASSQIGYVSRYKGMSLLTPTEREARLAVGDFNIGLVVLAEALRKQAMAKNILLTLGAEGLLVHATVSSTNEWLTDRIPAMNKSPKDVSGAGDSLLTGAGLSMAVGADIWRCAYLGSVAAACQLGRIGNIPLTADELRRELLL